MANTVSSVKRVRTTARRTAINRARKSRLRYQIRVIRKLIASNDQEGALAALPKTFSVLDRAAKTGIIKRNTAARYKSRVTRRVRALATAA